MLQEKSGKFQLFGFGMHLAKERAMKPHISTPQKTWLIVLGVLVAILVALSVFFPALPIPGTAQHSIGDTSARFVADVAQPALAKIGRVVSYWLSR